MRWPHMARFIIGFGGGIIAVAIVLATHHPVLAAALALPVFLLSSLVAERVFRRYATKNEIKRDLEDRVANPPT